MAGIFGKVTEHPEVPVTDPGRFTIEILAHDWEARPRVPYYDQFLPLALRPCGLCGEERRHFVHPPLFEEV